MTLQFLAQSAVQPLAICIFLTLAATAPPEMRTICFAMFGVYSLVFGGFAGSVLLGAVSDAIGGLHGIVVSLSIIAPVCVTGGFLLLIGSRYVRRDITLVIEDVIERYAEGKRRQSGGAIPALQVHNLDFYYGTNQVLFDLNLEIAEGEMVALLGTNGAGKSTLLRAISGLSHPHRGVIRIFGMNCTYLEPEQIIEQGVALLVGGKMTFPGLTVRDNLRIGGHILRRDRSRSAGVLKEALDVFPELRERIDQPAGTLSGGEQQMLALARVMMTQPRLLMIDELALGLAPMTVERLMGMVRRINEEGTTVILVEQSVNRAMSLAERCFFIERGELRFDGPTAELIAARRSPPTGVSRYGVDGPGLGAPNAGRLGTKWRHHPGDHRRPGLWAAGDRIRARLPHQSGAQLRPGSGRGHRSGVPGQADRRFQVRVLVRAGPLHHPGRRGRRPLGTGPAPSLQPAPGPGHGGHDRPEPGVARADRLAVHPSQEPLQTRPGSLQPLVHGRIGDHHARRGPDPHRGAHRGHRIGHRRPLDAMGPLDASDVRERGLGPALWGVDPAYLDAHLDRGRSPLGLHGHSQRARADQRADTGAQPGPPPHRTHRSSDRRHGQSHGGLRGGRRGRPVLRAAAVEHRVHRPTGAVVVRRPPGSPAGAGASPAQDNRSEAPQPGFRAARPCGWPPTSFVNGCRRRACGPP